MSMGKCLWVNVIVKKRLNVNVLKEQESAVIINVTIRNHNKKSHELSYLLFIIYYIFYGKSVKNILIV